MVVVALILTGPLQQMVAGFFVLNFKPCLQHFPTNGQPNWAKSQSQTEEPAKVGTCVHDRRALQQLALNVHVKHSDLT